ncbi:MAG TPA: sugar transferase [Parafilimonas sp.]|nr:sugar transferase [Parafilimonas sp.]
MKRGFDVIASSFILLITLPVTIITCIAVWIFLGTPIIFSQLRPGKNCKPFRLLKFRTMTKEKDEEGKLLSNEKRHTRFGKYLRSTSLDELPGFINVLKGDMSIVGPRPLKTDYITLYKGDQIRRHEVKPGITGWAQVNGRNAITFTERFKMDVWYINNKSFLLDMKILWLTFIKVIKRENISPKESIEVVPFDGTN